LRCRALEPARYANGFRKGKAVFVDLAVVHVYGIKRLASGSDGRRRSRPSARSALAVSADSKHSTTLLSRKSLPLAAFVGFISVEPEIGGQLAAKGAQPLEQRFGAGLLADPEGPGRVHGDLDFDIVSLAQLQRLNDAGGETNRQTPFLDIQKIVYPDSRPAT